MRGLQVTDDGLSPISKLNLSSLTLDETMVRTLQALKNMKSLKVLSADSTNLDDSGLAVIGTLTNLENLSLQNSDLTRKTFAPIFHLQKLTSLNLINCNHLSLKDIAYIFGVSPGCDVITNAYLDDIPSNIRKELLSSDKTPVRSLRSAIAALKTAKPPNHLALAFLYKQIAHRELTHPTDSMLDMKNAVEAAEEALPNSLFSTVMLLKCAGLAERTADLADELNYRVRANSLLQSHYLHVNDRDIRKRIDRGIFNNSLRLSAIYGGKGDLQQANSFLNEAKARFDRLGESDTFEEAILNHTLAIFYSTPGKLFDKKASAEYWMKSENYFVAKNKESSGKPFNQDSMTNFQMLANQYRIRGLPEKEIKIREEEKGYLSDTAAKNGELLRQEWFNKEYAGNLAELAEILRTNKAHGSAQKAEELCIEGIKYLHEYSPGQSVQLGDLYMKLGYIHLEMQDKLEQSISDFDHALLIYKAGKDKANFPSQEHEITWAKACANFHLKLYDRVIPLVKLIINASTDLPRKHLEYSILIESLEKTGHLDEAYLYKRRLKQLEPKH